jgi:pSer/pThr/pTyr-binding forkhead associated (FHA) protein
MWQSLQRASTAGGLGRVPPLRLEVRQKGQPAAVRSFMQAEVIVGRDPLSDIPLKDKAVSTRHARLSFHDGQWWVDDMGSTNGTQLNRDRLLGATVLIGGDEIKCGSTRLMVTLAAEKGLEAELGGVQDE